MPQWFGFCEEPRLPSSPAPKEGTDIMAVLMSLRSPVSTSRYLFMWAFGALALNGCGSEHQDGLLQSRVTSTVQRSYGTVFDVPLYCGGNSPAQSLDVVLEAARRLSAFCEQQNLASAKEGYVRCPTGLCQQEYSPGSKAAPTMKFTVSNGSSMSSMFGGYGGSMGGSSGSSSSSSSVFGSRIYVTLEFNLPLARSPDVLACVNPLNSSVQTTILGEIGRATLNSKPGPCIPQ